MIHRLDEVDNVGHCPVWHCGSDVARNGVRKSRTDVRLHKLFFPCALSVKNIAETLNKNVSRSKHIGKLADLLGVCYRLIERITEIV